MDRKDIVLLVIESASDEGLSPLQLQKSLFIIGQSQLAGLPADFYIFRPYNYGPFCEEIYRDTDVLVAEGMVFNIPVAGQSWSKYVITPKGQSKGEEIKKENNVGLVTYIKDTVQWVSSLTFSELLRAIYAKYPEYRVNSVFQE
jgi:uncharacterized protein YwgA